MTCSTCSSAGSAWSRTSPHEPRLEGRRREVEALLEEIRAPAPRQQDILHAVHAAAGGELPPERLARIAAEVMALYGAR
jgi:hypothetical protein